jgi:hypothetical protein
MLPFKKKRREKEKFVQEYLQIEEYPLLPIEKQEKKEEKDVYGAIIIEMF